MPQKEPSCPTIAKAGFRRRQLSLRVFSAVAARGDGDSDQPGAVPDERLFPDHRVAPRGVRGGGERDRQVQVSGPLAGLGLHILQVSHAPLVPGAALRVHRRHDAGVECYALVLGCPLVLRTSVGQKIGICTLQGIS